MVVEESEWEIKEIKIEESFGGNRRKRGEKKRMTAQMRKKRRRTRGKKGPTSR